MVRIPTAEDAKDCFNLNIISDWTDVIQEGNARLQSSKNLGFPPLRPLRLNYFNSQTK